MKDRSNGLLNLLFGIFHKAMRLGLRLRSVVPETLWAEKDTVTGECGGRSLVKTYKRGASTFDTRGYIYVDRQTLRTVAKAC